MPSFQFESVAKLILDLTSLQRIQQPEEYVINQTQKQLMQFIRLPKQIEIAERVLPDLVADWVNSYSLQSINISFLQKC